MNSATFKISGLLASAALLASIALPTQAQEFAGSPIQTNAVTARYTSDQNGRALTETSTRSRADVRAEFLRALASGEIQNQVGEHYGETFASAPSATGGLSRAEVRAETARALKSGEVDALTANSYDTSAFARASRTAPAAVLSAGGNGQTITR